MRAACGRCCKARGACVHCAHAAEGRAGGAAAHLLRLVVQLLQVEAPLVVLLQVVGQQRACRAPREPQPTQLRFASLSVSR